VNVALSGQGILSGKWLEKAQKAMLGQAVQQPAIQSKVPAGTAAAVEGVPAASDGTAAVGVAGTAAAEGLAGTGAAEGLAGTAAAGLAGTAAEGQASSSWPVELSYPKAVGKQTTATAARGRHREWHSPCKACRKRSDDQQAQSGGRPQSVPRASS